MPIAAGFDFGGVLWWTQYVLGIGICVTAALAMPSLVANPEVGFRHHRLLIPLGLWFAFASLHCLSASHSMVAWLSPATASAYQDWLNPLMSNGSKSDVAALSVAPDQTRHSLAFMVMLLPLAWASSQVFTDRRRLGFLMGGICVGVSLHAIYAFTCLLVPEWSIRPVNETGTDAGFGTFVNRNNIALHFNLGLAAGLGLLSWRFTTVIGQQVDEEDFEMNDLVSLIYDRGSMLAVFTITLCFAALLTCGSRSGLASMLGGALFAFGLFRGRRGWLHIPIALVGILLVVAVVMAPFGNRETTLDRLDDINVRDGTGIVDNDRWTHWSDAVDTTVAHLPAGSGLGTYAYAYLPHQQKSVNAWFHHADNLWLELAVEQGLPGILFVIALVVLIVMSLRRLQIGSTPIDQGIRTTGWYALGTIAVSQTLDFGLILPANLMICVVLYAAVMARSEGDELEEVEQSDVKKPVYVRRDDKIRWRTFAVSAGFGVVALLLASLSIPTLRADAEDDAVLRAAKIDLKDSFSDFAVLEYHRQRLQQRIDERESAELLAVSSAVERQLTRIKLVDSLGIADPEKAVEAYGKTRMSIFRRAWRHPETDHLDLTPDASEGFQRSLDRSIRALKRMPLSIQPRASLIQLDFVHRQPELTKTALNQLAVLQNRNPNQLFQLARMAAVGDEIELAESFLRKSTEMNPAMTEKVVDFACENPNIQLANSVHEANRQLRIATAILLANSSEDEMIQKMAPEFISISVEKLKCDECESRGEKAYCHQIAGDAWTSLDDLDRALEHYEDAVRLDTNDVTLRLKWIRRLREAGRNQKALQEAQRARSELVQSAAFEQVIQQMADEDVEEAKKRNSQGKR